MDENAMGRAIRICIERHRSHWLVELYLPNHLLALQINDAGDLAFERAAHCIFAVWRDVHVVHRAIDCDALYILEGLRIDYIESARLCADANQYLRSVFGDRD